MQALDQLNIANLTSLWQKMGVEDHSEFATDGLSISPTWPNRFWFEWHATSAQINELNHFLHCLPTRAVIPVWTGAGEQAAQLERYLQDECFQILFEQLAMYLDLQTIVQQDFQALTQQDFSPLNIIKVQTTPELIAWTETASAAFGYWIDINALQPLIADSNVQLLLVKKNDQPAATALIYKTGDIIGAHLVGVRENFRGQGIAKNLMLLVIQQAVVMGGKYLTLQASSAGEPLYRNLGFVAQFVIKNYQRVEK